MDLSRGGVEAVRLNGNDKRGIRAVRAYEPYELYEPFRLTHPPRIAGRAILKQTELGEVC